MNKKVILLLLIVVVAGILLTKQFFFSKPVETQPNTVPQPTSMREILQQIDEREVPLLVHVYALNPNCPNCDVAFIETELAKVATLEEVFGEQIHIIRINIFDYTQGDISLLARRLLISQAPSTVIIHQQEVINKETGPISQRETQLLLEEVIKS